MLAVLVLCMVLLDTLLRKITQSEYGRESPRYGDVIMWGETYTNRYGHVAIVVSNIGNKKDIMELSLMVSLIHLVALVTIHMVVL